MARRLRRPLPFHNRPEGTRDCTVGKPGHRPNRWRSIGPRALVLDALIHTGWTQTWTS